MNCASIMMVTYNRLDLTKRTIASLLKTVDYPFRLIIVDNGSADDTPNYLNSLKINDSYFVGLEIKLNKENKGIAYGRNQCLLIADKYKDEWLSTIDNDVEFPQKWLSECISILEENKNYGMIGVNMEDVYYPLVTRSDKTFQHKAYGNLGTACTVFNKNLHEKLGFFIIYSLYGEEDADLGSRVHAINLELGYIKDMGNHFGVGELDQGEYRKFKDDCRSSNISQFQKNCIAYMNGTKDCYIAFEETRE